MKKDAMLLQQEHGEGTLDAAKVHLAGSKRVKQKFDTAMNHDPSSTTKGKN